MSDYHTKYVPGELVYFIEGDRVSWEEILSVTFFEGGMYYELFNSRRPWDEAYLFHTEEEAKEALENSKKSKPKYKRGDFVWWISEDPHYFLFCGRPVYKVKKGVVMEVGGTSSSPEYKVLYLAGERFWNAPEGRLFGTETDAKNELEEKLGTSKKTSVPPTPPPCAAEFKKLNERLDKLAGGREVVNEWPD